MKNNHDRSGRHCPARTGLPCVIRSCILLPVLLVIALSFAACTRYIPREDLPPPINNSEDFPEQVETVIIPLAVFGTTPNEGTTLGALTAILLHDRKDEVNTLLAPQVNYNPNFGVTGTLYGAFYPDQGRSWEMNLSKSYHVNEDYELRYIDSHLMHDKLEGNAFGFYFTDGSARFFGFQSTSSKENETNYGDQELGVTLLGSYALSDRLSLLAGERVRKVNIVQGAITSLPYIGDVFTPQEVPGIDGFFVHVQRIGLEYSSLDSPKFPTGGDYARFSVEVSMKALGSDANYRHYDVELKKFIPYPDDRFVAVFHAAYNQTLGNEVPFLERSILGGENTLRGYGRNRFIDSSYLLFNFEERIRVFRWEVFGVDADWEVVPFLDAGAVAESILEISSNDIELNPGIGLRASVKPNIVGRVDIGFGNEGMAVFAGLGYPF